ncbi:universal stress protein [Haloprofundus salilacus]|uniref:universal stress protein n=1 Tax=Haloprofundus salilacus TaxID=2876190 RepID=UPI001CC9A99E|nr:universal stress protein [Haloprofundus salilacus]
MQRGFVVVDDTETHRTLLEEAVRFASSDSDDSAELVLFSWLTPERVDENFDALESIEKMEHTSYEAPSPLDSVRQFVRQFAEETLTNLDRSVDYEIVTVVADEDELGTKIIDTAETHGCDHVFITGQKRSPTGKVLFGDVAQQVILNFDGLVTTAMD